MAVEIPSAPEGWQVCPLRDVADIRFSNVDKRSNAGEVPVRLCNYVDVYNNDYITSDLEFMSASASQAEIGRFGLTAGDVIITKDSETPDDIGVPAVVSTDAPALVCGYHLALIRPKRDRVDPIFLAKQLASDRVARTFAKHANGSTRYGLGAGLIAELPLLVPQPDEQHRIAAVLKTVDELIQSTETMVEKQSAIKEGLMQDLLTRGLQEDGDLRPDALQAPMLYRETPIGSLPMHWGIERLGQHLSGIEQGWSPDCEPDPAESDQWGVLKTTAVVWDGFQDHENKALPPHLTPVPSLEVRSGDVLMTRGGPNSRVGVVVHVDAIRSKLMLSDKLYRLKHGPSFDSRYLALALSSAPIQLFLSTLKTGLAESQTNISQSIVRRLWMPVPDVDEQKRISERVVAVNRSIKSEALLLQKLRQIKSGLMQDLLTGKVRSRVRMQQIDPMTLGKGDSE